LQIIFEDRKNSFDEVLYVEERMTIKTQIRIHKFGSFPDSQIRNLPGSTNPRFYRKQKFEILPYFVIQNSIGFYNLEWKKTLTETKIYKKNPKVKKFTYLCQKHSKSPTKNVRLKEKDLEVLHCC